MKLIVGLGNPGHQYEKTRHNIGFMIAEQFLKDYEPVEQTVWTNEAKFKSDIADLDWQPKQGKLEKVVLAKPKTYMNNSGMAIKVISSKLKVQSSDIWVIHDDIDLPVGSIRIRFGGGTAGHKGLESIMESLGTEKFWRFRMGIGRPVGIQNSEFRVQNKGVEDYVLGVFTASEKGKVREMIKRGSLAIQSALEDGLEVAMNKYNTK